MPGVLLVDRVQRDLLERKGDFDEAFVIHILVCLIIGLCEHTWHLNARLALLKIPLRIFKAGENFIDAIREIHGPLRPAISPVWHY